MSNSSIKIIDGSVGTELQRRGVPMNPACWSANAHITHPEVLLEIHRDYLDAGATVISTNTFLAGRHVLEADGIDNFEQISRNAVDLATQAREEFAGDEVLIAGCLSTLPPLNQASDLPRGKRIERNFQEQANLLAAAGVDVLLVEVLLDSESAASMLKACCETGLPVWAGLSAIRDAANDTLMTFRQPGKLVDLVHESFESLLATVCEYPVEVIGVMHTELDLMVPALRAVKTRWQGPLLAYAKIGIADQQDWNFYQTASPDLYATHALQWIEDFHVSVVGGCCGTQPGHVQAISAQLPGRR
ncbi:MAG: homocysteine S-methyltransferase family protein [Gammaproteobacteria bacterium]